MMQSYSEEYYWWELVAIGRRFLICASAALLSPRVDALTLSIFVILSVSLFIHVPPPLPPSSFPQCNIVTLEQVRASPFVFPLNNSLETANLTMVMFNYLAGASRRINTLFQFILIHFAYVRHPLLLQPPQQL